MKTHDCDRHVTATRRRSTANRRDKTDTGAAGDGAVSRPRVIGLFDVTATTLRDLMLSWGEPPYRATQVFEWVYGRGAHSYEQMSNLPKTTRATLSAALPIYASTVVCRRESRDGTVKHLLAWPDGATSECVLISEGRRRTACISSQVGCPVHCAFCASGMHGLQRQLSTGEIVEQAMRIRQACESHGRLSNVVFMGLGEPLANYGPVLDAVRTINAPWGMRIGARKVTISTIGLPQRMRRLAHEGLQVTLAVSLHAPSEELRRKLIPWASGVTIESLIDAGNYYFEKTGREITLEYVLLGGVNDTSEHAHQLADVAHKMRSNVNLLAYNPVAGLPFVRPESAVVRRFVSVLRARGVTVHVRHSRGMDIDAACGQLRRSVRSQRSAEWTSESHSAADSSVGKCPDATPVR